MNERPRSSGEAKRRLSGAKTRLFNASGEQKMPSKKVQLILSAYLSSEMVVVLRSAYEAPLALQGFLCPCPAGQLKMAYEPL